MTTKLQELKWELYQKKQKLLLLWGLKNGYVIPYDDKLIGKLRNVYYGGVPASILLLSDGMSNGYCYDRALLMSSAFLDEEDDVSLVYATVDNLKLNPKFIGGYQSYADHCFVERVTKDGQHLIYDTTGGFVYDKRLYWMMEHPRVRKINNKQSIIDFIKAEEYYHPEDVERDKYMLPLILPNIERSYGRPTEMYTLSGIELLQREIEHFKNVINYDGVCQEISEDMKRLGLRK